MTAEKDAGPHDYSGHNWWECEVCHQRVSDILDARLRKSMLAEGYPEDDVDRMIAQARDVGSRLRAARVTPPAVRDNVLCACGSRTCAHLVRALVRDTRVLPPGGGRA